MNTYHLWQEQCEGQDPQNLRRVLLLAQARETTEGLESLLKRFMYVVTMHLEICASDSYMVEGMTSEAPDEKVVNSDVEFTVLRGCLLYTSPRPRD